MKPIKEQAKELYQNYLQRIPTAFGNVKPTSIPKSLREELAKYCALDCVDEIIKFHLHDRPAEYGYDKLKLINLKKLRNEINKL